MTMPQALPSSIFKTYAISNIAYKKKCQLLILLCVLLIGVIFQRGLQLGLVESVDGNRIRYHAIPVAVSVLYHGHPHDYTALREVALPFQGADSVKKYLANSIQKKIDKRDVYFWVADDKGSADFVIAAFKLFGPKLQSLYLFWFVCLLVTSALFVAGFKGRLWCLGLLGLTLTGIYTAVSTLPLANEAIFLNAQGLGKGPQSAVSIYEIRTFDVLGMIAVVHICLFAMRRSWRSSGWQITVLLGQVGFFFFLYHARSSLGWQLVAMVSFLCLVFTYRLWRSREKQVKKLPLLIQPVFVLAILILASVTLSIYKHTAYNTRYFQDMGVRTFWHNALMGINERGLAQTYKLAVSDFDAAAAVIAYSAQGTCATSVAKIDPQGLLNSLGGYGEKDWFAYEDCAKKLYFSLWKKHSFRMAYNYLVIKPQITLAAVLSVSRSAHATLSEGVRHQLSVGWHPLTGTPLAFALVILLFVNKALYKRRGLLFVLLAVLLVASLIPSMLFYSVVLTLGGFFVTLTILSYLLILIGVRSAGRWLYATPAR